MKKGMNHLQQKQYNRGLIFQGIVTRDESSRCVLARKSSLTKMTLSNIISEFIDMGYVMEDPTAPASARNIAQRLILSPDAPKIAGVLIYRTYIAAVLCDYRMQVLRSKRVELTEFNEQSLMETAFAALDEVIAGVHPIAGIGVSAIGPLDNQRGVLLNPPRFCGVHDVPIVDLFAERYHLPVYLGHHHDNMALAEKFYGAGRPYHDFLFFNTDGINLSIVTGHELLSSFSGFPCDLEHFSVQFSGGACIGANDGSCGNVGCLGNYLDFRRAAAEGTMDAQLEIVTTLFTTLVNLLNPQAIILGDDAHFISEENLARIERELNERFYLHRYRHVDVMHAQRREDLEVAASVIGVIAETFKGNLLFDYGIRNREK